MIRRKFLSIVGCLTGGLSLPRFGVFSEPRDKTSVRLVEVPHNEKVIEEEYTKHGTLIVVTGVDETDSEITIRYMEVPVLDMNDQDLREADELWNRPR